jgi:hypothetical protein
MRIKANYGVCVPRGHKTTTAVPHICFEKKKLFFKSKMVNKLTLKINLMTILLVRVLRRLNN